MNDSNVQVNPTYERWRIAGANPSIVSYNASAVKIYNATNSLASFENKNILLQLQCKNALAYHNAGVVVVNS
jgi:hypothetical protein